MAERRKSHAQIGIVVQPRSSPPDRGRHGKWGRMVGVAGFEPTTLCPPDKCATRLRYTPTCGKPYKIGPLDASRNFAKNPTPLVIDTLSAVADVAVAAEAHYLQATQSSEATARGWLLFAPASLISLVTPIIFAFGRVEVT